jgi:hypothetical protein
MNSAAVRTRHVTRGAVSLGETMSGGDVLRWTESAARFYSATTTSIAQTPAKSSPSKPDVKKENLSVFITVLFLKLKINI